MPLLEFVPLAVAVVAGLAQIAKRQGMSDNIGALFEVGLGITLVLGGEVTGAVIVADNTLQSTHYFWALLYGVIVGLTSAGLYQYGEQIALQSRKRNGSA